jgi:dihydroorotate dehydrogenase
MKDIPWSQRLLHRLEPETAHLAALSALKLGVAPMPQPFEDPILATRVWHLDFASPIGLAAGFDKDAEVVDPMLRAGFGFVEAGSVTPKPQPGNPKPRLYRLTDDRAVINRFGFNSQGIDAYAERLRARRRRGGARGIVGANLGKNKETVDGAADYVVGIRAVAGLADYLVCNISSPNTPGLRGMQARAPIEDLLGRVLAARGEATPPGCKPPPLLAKVGPDLDAQQVQDIAEVALATGLDGLIIGNTTIERPSGLLSRDAAQAGGLSGAPLLPRANACLADFSRATGGRLPIIGCGGVSSGADAYAKIRSGASLVQLYSALVFYGLPRVNQIKRELAALLRRDGFASIADAVGVDLRA